jgi:rhodanese-related sulfurtransferase
MFSFLRRPKTPEITVDQLDELWRDRAVRILDVREDSEFTHGHVPGAIHVPMKQLPARAAGLPRTARYAVICQSGSRSRRATDYLVAQGFDDAVSVRGGTGAWARGGRPLESPPGHRKGTR